MVTVHSSVKAALATTVFSALTRAASLSVCKDATCGGDCPFTVDVLNSPDCSIVYRDQFNDLGYSTVDAGGYALYINIPQPESGQQWIIGSGAGCGAIVGRYENSACVRQPITSSLSFSLCHEDCAGAGDKVIGGSALSANVTKRATAKRDCDTFTQDGGTYEVIGESHSISDTLVGPGSFNVGKEVSTSTTTSFSASVGDPFGIISESVGFDFTKSDSESLSYTIELSEGQVGYVAWSPTMTCVSGTLSNCEDASDEQGQVCTAKKADDGHVPGQYNFVSTGGSAKRSVKFRS
ncbi:hypothetical protein BJX64DRAFT_287269 [Aspergillus heterothallicus]